MFQRVWRPCATAIQACCRITVIVEEIADRALPSVKTTAWLAAGSCEEILGNIALAQVNLVDEEFHLHPHGRQTLIHAHDGGTRPALELKKA